MNELSRSQGLPVLFTKFNYPPILLGHYSSYDSIKDAISNYLKGLAKRGLKCSFRELYSILNIPLFVTPSLHRNLITQICWEINDTEYRAGRPLIGVLLCSESAGYITGSGFFDLMDFPEFCDGLSLDRHNSTHQAAFFGVHANRVWIYWKKQKDKEEKKAAALQKRQTQGIPLEEN